MDQGSAVRQIDNDPRNGTSEYRALAPMALVALGLGLLSPVAWAAPFLLIVPAAAVGASLLALGSIRRAEGRLAGGALARIGLVLALISAASAVVRGPVRARLMQRQLDAAAQHWVDVLAEGRIEDSLALLSPRAMHGFSPEPSPGAPPPAEDEVRAAALEGLQKDPLVKRLAGSPQWELRRASPVMRPIFEGATIQGAARYELVPTAAAAGEVDEILSIAFLRAPGFEADGRPWRIQSWKLLDADEQ